VTVKDRDGFSLLELLLVIAIFGILATMSVPIIGQTLKVWRTDRFSRSVLTAHQAARFHAITERTLIQIRYNMDKDSIRFFACSNLKDDGTCKAGNWNPYPVLAPIRSNGTADLWSVGTKTSGEACLYYKFNGQVAGPYDRSGASGEDCTGDTLSGVHITWKPNPPSANEDHSCKWNTIFHAASGTSNPIMLEYGAYGNFGSKIGETPTCLG
jgi:prepilin-type N-terminal cleavage/methylation domain-containing protein